VRTIFRSYLKLGSLNLLLADLRKRGIVTKVRTLKTGETVGGVPFARGPSPICCATDSTLVRWHSKERS
jgi:site-specific DNA recombinase